MGSPQVRSRADSVDAEVIETPTGAGLRLLDLWQRGPQWLRIAGPSVVLAVALVVTVASVSRQERERREEQRVNDVVAVEATLAVVSSSTHPLGGSVNFFANVRNDGPRSVYVRNLTISQDGLRVIQRSTTRLPLVAAGESVELSLSVRLDCAMRSLATGGDVLRGLMTVESQNGRSHRVVVAVHASSLTNVATTLCAVSPRLFRELSGPLAETSRA
ncbi:MAG: hypothetical protein M3P23_13145 [Actinomycetota bacterium]|nr:hypothetical protein [Actinomycetota bacterium]